MNERKLNNRVSNAVIGALLVISLCLIAFPAYGDMYTSLRILASVDRELVRII